MNIRQVAGLFPMVVVGAAFAAACGNQEPAQVPVALATALPVIVQTAAPAQTVAAAAPPNARISRAEYNRIAIEENLATFWRSDDNHNGELDPDELEVWGLTSKRSDSVAGGVAAAKFTAQFEAGRARVLARFAAERAGNSASAESERVQLVRQDLAQGRPTLVLTDLRAASAADRAFVARIAAASAMIEHLFDLQMGTAVLVPEPDAPSQALFFRNHGPRCSGPATENNPSCSSTAFVPTFKLSGLYPMSIMSSGQGCTLAPSGRVTCANNEQPKPVDFCKSLDKSLMDPFTVVTGKPGALMAVPYNQVWGAEMALVANELSAAAREMSDPSESALRDYLSAAAQSFRDNRWAPADEAWAKMGVNNSRFYLRIAPDEVYGEPCSTKALFHVSFGLINKGSLRWQSKLGPLKSAMEAEIAKIAGAPYRARAVSFKLPDFVDIAINAGDSRSASGATIGQSLPNFGAVANQGRGRTVAMTNFYTDADSLAASVQVAASLFCADTMKVFTSDAEPQLMSTVLHEAAHNLGPAHQFKVGGKIDREVFGGPLASTLEELKAQTAAEYFTDWLVGQKVITLEFANQAHVRDLFWAFGHISRGMYDENMHPKNYSQLAAIQFGSLMRDSAVLFRDAELAANGTDLGCYSAQLDKFPSSFATQLAVAAGIKARGDKAQAQSLQANFVDAGGSVKSHLERIQLRVLRTPKASFVYSLRAE